MPPLPAPAIWTLTDERAGNFHQADALARAIGGPIQHITLRFPPPWRWTAPRGVRGALPRLPLPEDATWPDIAIGCGRQSALALRALRNAAAGKIFCVQILDPRIDSNEYDLVVTPGHDALQGNNVIRTLGALNAVNDAWLKAAREALPALSLLPRPLTSVMVGGPHRDAPMALADIENLGNHLLDLQRREDGSVLLCASRRTPSQLHAALREIGSKLDARTWMDARDGINPYRAGLACAERIVVTADSVNMLSEACATGVGVVSFARTAIHGKLGQFDAELRSRQLLCGWLDAPRIQPALRETEAVASNVLERWRASRSH